MKRKKEPRKKVCRIMVKRFSLANEIKHRLDYWYSIREIFSRYIYAGAYREECFYYDKTNWRAHALDVLLFSSIFELGCELDVPDPDSIDTLMYDKDGELDFDENVDIEIEMAESFFDISIVDAVTNYGWSLHRVYGIDEELSELKAFSPEEKKELLSLLGNSIKDSGYDFSLLIAQNKELYQFVKGDKKREDELKEALKTYTGDMFSCISDGVFGNAKGKINDYFVVGNQAYIYGEVWYSEEVQCPGYYFNLETLLIMSVIDRWVKSDGKEVPEWQKVRLRKPCTNG